MSISKVELRSVSKTFHTNGRTIKALEDISFGVHPGEFVTIIGPSGSGKSTIFNLIVGLLDPDEGEICLDGETCQQRTGHVGYMPQRDLLLPWRSVIDNVTLAQELLGVPAEISRSKAEELLPLFGLDEFGAAYPSELSGGMRQRAALLRTMLTDRDVLLLDEPFGALDALTRRELQDWLLDIWRRFKKTIIFITHDVDEALYLADRVLVLSARPGKVLRFIEVDLPRPRRQGMIASPAFVRQLAELLETLGVKV
jgi:ABC-type nitrate/sulfonate/bicarbonate transport system ATPase subunit